MSTASLRPRADLVVSLNRWFHDGERYCFDPQPLCRRERRLMNRILRLDGSREQSLVNLMELGGPQHCCVLYRTSVVRAAGGYADDLEPHAEKKLLFRLLCRGAQVAINPRITSARRIHRSPGRSEWERRPEEPEHRMSVAESYADALREAGLLRHEWLHQAFTAHVMGRLFRTTLATTNAEEETVPPSA
jgi:hypothetical protein